MPGPAVIPRLRWWIGGLLFASTVINYIDRQTLSVLGPTLKEEFHWNNSDFALVLIAFRIAYAVMQTVTGKMLDWLGTRKGLLLSVTWYSAAAMLTSLASGLKSFMFFRFLLGSGKRRTGRGRPRRCRSGSRGRSAAGRWRCSTAGRRWARRWRRCWFWDCTGGRGAGVRSS